MEPTEERPRGLAPGGAVRGELALDGSKSIAQRALLAAALADGTTRIARLPRGADVARALELVAACGARVTRVSPAAVAVEGAPPARGGWRPAGPVSAGESGTLARLALAALAFGARGGGTVEAVGSLRSRGSEPLLAALAAAGVAVERGPDAPWPATVRGAGPPPESALADPVSSQEVSALLLALAAHAGETRLRVTGTVPSRPYVALTVAVLARFGATVEGEAPGELRVRGPLRAPAEPFTCEPDASSAAVALAAACLSGGALRIPGLGRGSAQGDARAPEFLAAFGCDAQASDEALAASGAPTRGADLDLADHPDLAPVLAVVAAGAALAHGAASRLTGLGALRRKESDRLAGLASLLDAVGVAARVDGDALAIGPGAPTAGALVLDPRGDHRMAFTVALLGLLRPGVRCATPGVVAKSWPDFWSDLARLGAVAS